MAWNKYWENNWDCYTAHFGVEPVPADFSLYRYNLETGEGGAIAHTGWKVNEYTEKVEYGIYKYSLMATTDRSAEYMNWSKRVHLIVEVLKPVVLSIVDDEEYQKEVKDYYEQTKWFGCSRREIK